MATNHKYEEIVDKLAMDRNLAAIAELAPGLTDNGPNAGQLSIAGAFAYDNVFLLNGVDINDNLFGTANNLFIEDAIQEVQVLTTGISAEYGRFSGGVINAVTKSGGNKFSGSFRTDITNPDWQDESLSRRTRSRAARARPHIDDTILIHTATLGGPVVKDRLWFFGAYRRENSADSERAERHRHRLHHRRREPPYEGKLTGRIAANHNLQADYISNRPTQDTDRPPSTPPPASTPRTLVDRDDARTTCSWRATTACSAQPLRGGAVLAQEVRLPDTGGTSTDIVDSPFLALGRGGIPVGPPLQRALLRARRPRGPQQPAVHGALSYFLSTGSAGRHDLKFGGEHFTSYAHGRQLAVGDGFVFSADPWWRAAQPVMDANGRIIPIFVPGVSRMTELALGPGRADQPQHALALRERPLAAQRPLDVQPRRAHGAAHHRRHAGRHRQHHAAPRSCPAWAPPST